MSADGLAAPLFGHAITKATGDEICNLDAFDGRNVGPGCALASLVERNCRDRTAYARLVDDAFG